MQITRGVQKTAIKTVIYGSEGIGKSTLASKFPDALFIDTEDSTTHMNVARFDKPTSWTDILDKIEYVRKHPDICKTLVIDTADSAERMCIEELCTKMGWNGLEGAGYGRGYQYLAEEFSKMLKKLSEVIKAGIHVVLTAHAAMRKFEQPDEMGAYDRWEMKLQKKTAPLVKEWADMVLFCNYKTTVVNVDGQGAQKGKNKVFGGERVMYTSHHNCWDAKNRFGLESPLPMEFGSIAALFGDIPKPVPKWQVLKEKMETDNVEEFDLQNLVGAKQWASAMDPIENYSHELIDFLLGDWEKVKAVIKENKEKEEIPFNKEEE